MQHVPLNGMCLANLYEATREGEIVVTKTGYVKKQRMTSHGYCIVSLYENGTRMRKCATVHSLVLMAFSGGPPQDGKRYTVDHIDRVRNNNHITNLRWATYAEQSQNSDVCLTKKRCPNRCRPLMSTDDNGTCETFPCVEDAANTTAKGIKTATSVRRIWEAVKTGEQEFGRFWDYMPPPGGEYRPIPSIAIHGACGYFAS